MTRKDTVFKQKMRVLTTDFTPRRFATPRGAGLRWASPRKARLRGATHNAPSTFHRADTVASKKQRWGLPRKPRLRPERQDSTSFRNASRFATTLRYKTQGATPQCFALQNKTWGVCLGNRDSARLRASLRRRASRIILPLKFLDTDLHGITRFFFATEILATEFTEDTEFFNYCHEKAQKTQKG
jgi:hypothetical protein